MGGGVRFHARLQFPLAEMPIHRRNARAREQAELTDHLLPNEQREQLETLYTQMAPAGLKPLWEALAQLVTPHPNSPACAHLWWFEHARDFLLRAGAFGWGCGRGYSGG